jgi:hypothetical protein
MDTQAQPHDPEMTAEPVTGPNPAPERQTMSRREMLIYVAFGGGGLVLLIAALFGFIRRKNDAMPGLAFVIPEGAGATVSNSTLVSAIKLPTEITFEPGEEAAISVRNDDSVPLRAGPFVVLPGQTYTQRFPNAGEFDIACTVDPAESISVTVKE